MGKENTSPVGIVSGPYRYTREPGNNGCFYGVLEKDGQVKTLDFQFPGKSVLPGDSMMNTVILIDYNFVDFRADPVGLGYPGFCKHAYFRTGDSLPDRSNGRQCHYNIAYPVGSTYEYIIDFFRNEFLRFSYIQHIKFLKFDELVKSQRLINLSFPRKRKSSSYKQL